MLPPGRNRTELRVVADVGDRPASPVDQIDEKLAGLGFLHNPVNRNLEHSFFLSTIHSKCGSSCRKQRAPSERIIIGDFRV